ncbi:thiamine pyrophosphate-dependent enzyme [Paraburkholderia sp. Ac-20347]|uniref:thiamine pyrophosphate-dependent enzyme n=1 Tax=Paraburkholderia sp. Ac-20347 TaxID=2703892 RepID=UPI00197F1D7C|nr:thiamine pyrophosphate-dependent enzyme [Paraburkholderia sp. Ac-20347]MBN3812510.1 3D-(3,5/4)-trihydroxycyclohexane-1,2-dione acylhydrolase (decyclizing) [Paraburkholderia sp. Ac-20347]
MSSNTVRLTTAQAILRYFGAQRVSRDGVVVPLIGGVFGIFGHGNGAGFGHALGLGECNLAFFQGKNEQAMVHAAIGYSKSHNLLSTLAVTTSLGPGATNLVTGAATATVNRVPVLLLPSDVFASRRQGPVLQGLEMPQDFGLSANDTLRPVSRYFDRITRPEQIIHSLPHATAALLDHANAGAVTIAVCQDVQGEAFDFPTALFAERVHHVDRVKPDVRALSELVSALLKARRPIIVAGGGVRYSGAEQALAEFSNTFGIPVVESLAGRSCGRDVQLNLGGVGFIGAPCANEAAGQADFVLAVGTRLADTLTGSHTLFQQSDVKVATINLSTHDLGKMGALPLKADAREGLIGLSRALTALNYRPDPEWRNLAMGGREEWLSKTAEIDRQSRPALTGFEVVSDVANATSRNDRVVFSSSTAIGHAHAVWNSAKHGELDMEYGFSCMGYELPAALGHALSRQTKGRIVAVVGDGTYLMCHSTELVTAVQEGASFTVVVLVNQGWQCIRGFQINNMGVEFGTQFRRKVEGDLGLTGEYVQVDYAANARSLGAHAFEVHSREELRDALASSAKLDGPVLIAAHTNLEALPFGSGAWWEIGSPDASQPEPLLAHRQVFKEKAAQHRWFV